MKRLVLIVAACLLSLGLWSCQSGAPAPTTAPVNESAVIQTRANGSAVTGNLTVHFIDVGQADAELVVCGERVMLIDGGNKADSNLIYAYLQKLGIDYIDVLVCTHAHEDHVGGLSGALRQAHAGVAYCPVTSYNSKAFTNFVDSLALQNLTITAPPVGQEFALGEATVQVLGPLEDYSETNDTSIVLRVVYGETSFLFMGDATRTVEQDLIAAGYDLAADVLKVGHHGSDTSTSYQFLREVMPTYAVIEVGKDNSYGHPHEEPLSRLRDAGVQVLRTDMQGDIICTSDGSDITWTVERNATVKTNPTER